MRALVLSHLDAGANRIFEDYCNGIRANADDYQYADYVEVYQRLGRRGFECHVEHLVERQGTTHLFLIWRSCDLTFDPRFLARLAKQVRVVMNFYDTEYFFEDVDRYYAQVADLVVLPDELSRYRYEHLGIAAHTSFSLFDRNAYRAEAVPARSLDVSFVGDVRQPGRSELLQFLRDNGVGVEAYGVGTGNGFIGFDEMVRLFNRSRINLNFTSVHSFENFAIALPRINQRIKQSKGRPIEVALCRGFTLSQHAPGIENMFVPGVEFDVFHGPQELLEKIRYYLANEETREALAGRAHARALECYDAAAGFRIIIDKLAAMPRRELGPMYLDAGFLRNYAAFRFFYIAQFVLGGKLTLAVSELGHVLRGGRLDLHAALHFAIRGTIDFVRERPKLDSFLKRMRRWIPMKVKY